MGPMTKQWIPGPSRRACSLVPRPHPLNGEKGLVDIERFLGSAESAVLISGTPIRTRPCCIIVMRQATGFKVHGLIDSVNIATNIEVESVLKRGSCWGQQFSSVLL